MPSYSSKLLMKSGNLSPQESSAALILSTDGRYLLQKRDDKLGVYFPNHWGLFGGALEEDETPHLGLMRELQEELGSEFCRSLDYEAIEKLGDFTFDFKKLGFDNILRHYFLINNAPKSSGLISLGEGRDYGFYSGEFALQKLKLVPYDGFVIWLHWAKALNSNI